MDNPEREKINILNKSHLDISYYVGPGPGGQKKNKTHSGVQIIHKETGAIGRSSATRSQAENKKQAFLNLLKTPKMKVWLNKKLYEIRNEETVEETVERMMHPDNLKVEIKNLEGKWVDENREEEKEACRRN